MFSAFLNSHTTSNLVKACAQGNLEYLKKHAKGLADVRDADGRNLLHIAASEAHMEIVRFLLQLHLDPNLTDKDGWSSLHCSCNKGALVISDMLINANANCTLANNQGTSIAHYAVRIAYDDPFRYLLVLSKLLDKGANLNKENQFGETPLHQAAFKGNELAVTWLVRNKAEIDHPTKKRATPLHMACMMGHKGVAEILLFYGADPQATSENGLPADMARNGKHLALLPLLENKIQGKPQPVVDNEAVIEDFNLAKSKEQTRFLGNMQYVTIKIGNVLKALNMDLTQNIQHWLEVLGSKLNLPDPDEYSLILNPPNMHSFALDPTKTVIEQLHLSGPDEVPTDIIYDVKKRSRLLDPKLQLVKLICNKPDLEELDSLARALVTIFYNSGKSMVLLNWALHSEVSEKAKSLLFREDSIFTKIVTNYLRLIGSGYLVQTLGATITSIATQKTSYEMDPNRPDFKKGNKKKLKQLVLKFISALLKSMDYCPVQIRALCMEIKTIVESRFPDVTDAAISGFIFLRFLCPGMTSPANYKILEEPPTHEATRGLILAAKVIQNIANGVDFGEKEPYLVCLNKFMMKRRGDIKSFLSALNSPEAPQGTAPVLIKITDEQENEAASRIEKHLKTLSKQSLSSSSPSP